MPSILSRCLAPLAASLLVAQAGHVVLKDSEASVSVDADGRSALQKEERPRRLVRSVAGSRMQMAAKPASVAEVHPPRGNVVQVVAAFPDNAYGSSGDDMDPYSVSNGPFPEAAVPHGAEAREAASSGAAPANKHRRSRREQGGDADRFPVEGNDNDGSQNPGQDIEDPTTEGKWQKEDAAASPKESLVLVDKEVRQQVNGSTPAGYIELGTPPKKLYVILDTGSDKLVAKTWDTIRRELRQVDGGIDESVMPSSSVYNHNASSSYVHLFADPKDKTANMLGGGKAHTQKRGYIAYGSGIAITDEGMDSVQVGGRVLKSFPLSEITADSLSMLHTKQGISGILGLQHMKNKTLGESVFTRAREHGGMSSFGYCRGNDNDGTFIWGDKATDGHKLPVIGQIHWALQLSKVKMIGGASTKKAAADTSADSSTGQDAEASGLEEQHGGGEVFPMPHQKNGQWVPSSLSEAAQVPDSEQEASTAAGESGIDPELKKEIGKMVTDVIDKVIDKVQHRTSKAETTQNMVESSKEVCGNGKCTAIIDTGSNIIAGPSEALKDMAKFANVKYDCSNLDKLPNIHLTLGDFKVTLPPKSYVMQVNLPKWAQGKGAQGMGGDGSGAADGSGAGGEGAGFAQDTSLHRVSDVSAENATAQLSPAARGWKTLIKELHETYGVDLSAALMDQNIGHAGRSDKLCMPAFAPLDKETAVGKLWVIGTPVFEQYYTRWSFPKGADSPSIYFKDKNTAQACQKSAASSSVSDASSDADSTASGSDSDASTTSEPAASDGSGFTAAANVKQVLRAISAGGEQGPGTLLRQDDTKKSILLDEGSVEVNSLAPAESAEESRTFVPRQVDLFDIRYPHWAKQLSDV